jgi:hypothetical protein
MARSNPTPAEIAQAVRDRGAVAFPGFFTWRTLLSGWFEATGGTARANWP